mmetsp:Transcript_88276/g.184473  ORF Transcript_88276/g.184473 Transcript_88276/m.184473 type:complete len:195 (-) Transcript_88276:1345-1929(-)
MHRRSPIDDSWLIDRPTISNAMQRISRFSIFDFGVGRDLERHRWGFLAATVVWGGRWHRVECLHLRRLAWEPGERTNNQPTRRRQEAKLARQDKAGEDKTRREIAPAAAAARQTGEKRRRDKQKYDRSKNTQKHTHTQTNKQTDKTKEANKPIQIRCRSRTRAKSFSITQWPWTPTKPPQSLLSSANFGVISFR